MNAIILVVGILFIFRKEIKDLVIKIIKKNKVNA